MSRRRKKRQKFNCTQAWGDAAYMEGDLRDYPESVTKRIIENVWRSAMAFIPSPCWHNIKIIVHYPLTHGVWADIPVSEYNPMTIAWKYRP